MFTHFLVSTETVQFSWIPFYLADLEVLNSLEHCLSYLKKKRDSRPSPSKGTAGAVPYDPSWKWRWIFMRL